MVDGTSIGLLLALTYATAIIPPSTTTPISVTITSGAKTFDDRSGASSTIIQSGGTLGIAQSGQNTDELQSTNKNTTITSGENDIRL